MNDRKSFLNLDKFFNKRKNKKPSREVKELQQWIAIYNKRAALAYNDNNLDKVLKNLEEANYYLKELIRKVKEEKGWIQAND